MKRLLASGLLLLSLGPAYAQAPQGAVSVINPFTVGGLTDLTARFIVNKLQSKFPAGIAVLNRPGAGGSVGVTEIVQATPDGTTIGISPTAALIDQPQMNNLPYKTPDDFDPLLNVITYYQFLAVRGDAPWKKIGELMDAIKKDPGKLRFASSGIGTAAHMNLAQLAAVSKADFVHVPFSGWAEGSAALLGGHVDALTINPGEGRQLANAGRIKILAAFAPERSRFYPDVPTFREVGYDAGVDLSFVILAPKGIPAATKSYIQNAVKSVVLAKEFEDFAHSREVDINYIDEAGTKAMLLKEYQEHSKLLDALGLRAK